MLSESNKQTNRTRRKRPTLTLQGCAGAEHTERACLRRTDSSGDNVLRDISDNVREMLIAWQLDLESILMLLKLHIHVMRTSFHIVGPSTS